MREWQALPRGAVRCLWAERRWLLATAALFTFTRLPNMGGWDEAFYVGQLVSIVADGDLRLQDDVVSIPRTVEEKYRILTTIQPSGALANTMGIGPAVVLSPFTAVPILSGHPPPWTAFRWGAAVAALVLLLLTAVLAVDAIRRLGLPDRDAALAVALVTIGGPLAVYGTRSYLLAHSWSAFLVALTLQQALVLSATPRRSATLGLGLAAGLACVNRWQDLVIVAPLAGAALAAPWPQHGADRSSGRLRLGALVATAGALALACQLLAWQKQFGSALLVPQGAGYMRWLSPQVVPLLFSSHGGLWPWAPGLALGLAGLGWLAIDRRARATAERPWTRWFVAAMVAGVLATLYVSACPEDWWGRDTFGPRRLTALTPLAAVGFAFLLSRSGSKTRVALTAAIALAGVCLASAHFSGHRDLSLLLFDRPDPWSPDPHPAAPEVRWMDPWGPLHFAKPGLTFSDTPGWRSRLAGLFAVALVVLAVRYAWRRLHRSHGGPIAAVAAALALVLVWIAALTAAPANTAANAAWKAFLEQPLDAGRVSVLPADMAPARDLVQAVAREAEARRPRP